MNFPIRPATEWKPNTEGLFELSEAIYRSALGVSQSTLKSMRASPAHCLYDMENARMPTRPMILGSAIHSICLEPHTWQEGKSHWVQPLKYQSTGMECPSCKTVTTSAKCAKCKCERVSVSTQKDWNANSDTCREWLESHAGLPIFTVDELENLGGMMQALKSHSQVGPTLASGVSEVASFCRDKETGLMRKARLDKIVETELGVMLCDVKKCQNARKWERDAYDLGSHIQAASNMDICRDLGLDVAGFCFFAVEEKPPHGIVTYMADDEFLMHGRIWHRHLLNKYAECAESGIWPSYPDDLVTLSPPKWASLPPLN